jgi:hypothetical protein
MSMQLLEGFDHFTVGELSQKAWSSQPFGAMVTGRFGGQALEVQGSGSSVGKVLPSTFATVIAGFAWQEPSGVHSAITSPIVELQTAAGATVARLISNGTNMTIKNSGGTVIGTGTTVEIMDTWYYFEMKIFVNGASGTCELRLNGVSEIATATGNFGSTNIGKIAFITGPDVGGASTTAYFDDVYVIDTGGSTNNTYLGDSRVVTSYANAAGTHTDWTPTTPPNYAATNEHPPDGDTSYVYSSTPGNIDSYNFTDIDGGASVHGVQVNLYARKDDAATRQIAPLIRQASTDYVGSTVTLGSSYQFYSQLYDQDPTSSNWTAANVNADEYGVKEIA